MKNTIKLFVYVICILSGYSVHAQALHTLKPGCYHVQRWTKLAGSPDTLYNATVLCILRYNGGAVRKGVSYSLNQYHIDSIGKDRAYYRLFPRRGQPDSVALELKPNKLPHFATLVSNLYFYSFSNLNNMIIGSHEKGLKKYYSNYVRTKDTISFSLKGSQEKQVYTKIDNTYIFQLCNTDSFSHLDLDKGTIRAISETEARVLIKQPKKSSILKSNFTSPTALNQKVNAAQYYLIDYFFVGCEPCHEEIPKLKSLYGLLDTNKIKLLGLSPFDNERRLSYFKEKYAIPYSIMDQEHSKEFAGYSKKISSYPTMQLLNSRFELVKEFEQEAADIKFEKIREHLKDLELLRE
jgi:peroxiredoxin